MKWEDFAVFYEAVERYNHYPTLEEDFADNATIQVYYPDYWGAKYDTHYFDFPTVMEECKNYVNADNHTAVGRCLVSLGDTEYATPCTGANEYCDKESGTCKTKKVVTSGIAGVPCGMDDDC